MKKGVFIVIFFGINIWLKAQDTGIAQLQPLKKVEWSGAIGANTSFYSSNRIFSNNGNPFTYNLNANVNARILNVVDIPITLIAGKYQNSFDNSFVQCSINPNYKWATLHIGNINPDFNPYTLYGFSIVGISTELKPGKLRFSAMYGKLASPVEIDTSGLAIRTPSFKRMGYGIKAGYGTNNNFIDFIYFQAKDDPSSIKTWNDPQIQKKLGDAGIMNPQQNKIIGFSSKISPIKDFTLNFDGGVSLLNRNIADTQNANPKGVNIFTANNLHYAGKASAGYNFKNFYLSANYERISPDYTSMGTYFFNNDIENITISPTGIMAKGKGSYNISAGLQKNNLNKQKTETTKRFIANANISYNPNDKWGFMLNYNNFSIRQFPTLQTLPNAILLRQVNQTFTFTPSYTIRIDSSATHSFSFTTNYNDVNDRNIITKQFGNMKSAMLSLNHSSFFTKKNNSINSGINFNEIKTFGFTNTQVGISAGYSQSFINQKLSANVNINSNVSFINYVYDGNIIAGSSFVNYQLSNKHSFTLNCTLTSTSSRQFSSYTDIIGSIGYQFLIK